MAAHSALRIARNGRVAVFLPTLDLLMQTVAEWRSAGHDGPAVAVCSARDAPELAVAGVRATTNPIRLALWHGDGPVTIYATYASLPVLAEAFEGVYGQRLAPLDLVVVDEAHRTSGSWGKAWSAVHDQAVIPSVRRLYMTATPRVWQERLAGGGSREGVRDPLPEELACSMDDEAVFGPVVFRMSLADGVAAGLLARYQVVVCEVRDPDVTPGRLYGEEGHGERVRGLRLGALQDAMLRTAVRHGLRSMITFHHRTLEAAAFAEGLPGVAAKLHALDPQRYPQRVWSGWLQGEHEVGRRRQVIAEFGRRADLAVLSNCRVLGEGVDIRAVDSVALLDPKGSPVDIVQAIGRALRQKPGENKLATLIVPVFLGRDEKAEDMMSSASYKPLVRVLQGLRAHDEQAIELLAVPMAGTEPHVAEVLGVPPEEGELESRVLLRFSAPRDPSMVAEWIRWNVIDTERQDWTRGFAAARRYAEREGHLLVPFGYVDAANEHPLGSWISEQRKAYAAGRLTGKRVRRLESLGMVWSVADQTFEENLASARAAFEEWGTLCLPRSAVALGRPVGQWLTNVRRPGGLGADPERAQRRRRQLASVDPHWAPPWPVDWQRMLAALRAQLAAGTLLGDVVPGVTVRGENMGRWLERQQQPKVWQALSDEQRRVLSELGVGAQPTAAGEASRGSVSRGNAFGRGLAALRQFQDREGRGRRPPRAHLEVMPDGSQVKVGVWVSNVTSPARWAKLSEQQRQAVTELGVG